MIPVSSISKKDFTRHFKIFLLNRELKQKELAEKVGISEYLLSLIITGRRRGLSYRSKICEILNVKESDIWNEN